MATPGEEECSKQLSRRCGLRTKSGSRSSRPMDKPLGGCAPWGRVMESRHSPAEGRCRAAAQDPGSLTGLRLASVTPMSSAGWVQLCETSGVRCQRQLPQEDQCAVGFVVFRVLYWALRDCGCDPQRVRGKSFDRETSLRVKEPEGIRTVMLGVSATRQPRVGAPSH